MLLKQSLKNMFDPETGWKMFCNIEVRPFGWICFFLPTACNDTERVKLLRQWTDTPAKTKDRYVSQNQRTKLRSKVNVFNGIYSVSWALSLKYDKANKAHYLPAGLPAIYAKHLVTKYGIVFSNDLPAPGKGKEYRKRTKRGRQCTEMSKEADDSGSRGQVSQPSVVDSFSVTKSRGEASTKRGKRKSRRLNV